LPWSENEVSINPRQVSLNCIKRNFLTTTGSDGSRPL